MGRGSFLARLSNPAAPDIDPNPLGASANDAARHRLELFDSVESLDLGWFWATDAHGNVTYISNNAAQAIGKHEDDVRGAALGALFVSQGYQGSDHVERPLPFLLSARSAFRDLPVTLNKDGSDPEIWWALSGKPQFDADKEFIGYRGTAKDITQSRMRDIDASRMAQFDALTGLSNRHRMDKRLTSVLTAYKSAKRSCALMMLDLDRFKQVNDTQGHPAGDELLKQVAQRLKVIVGNTGEIGRLGGDEFLIILPDIDDRGQLGDLGQRLIQMISQPYAIDGSRVIIGTSLGIAIAPYDGTTTEELISSTDLALYAAKDSGRGQFRFFSSDLKEGARKRKQIEEDLREALAQGQIEMYYQPVIDADKGVVAGFEALLRWRHPERGWVSPEQFVPIAEKASIIADLGEFALQRACCDAALWPEDLRISVNVSAVQFNDKNFLDTVKRALEASGLDANRLELEITESVFMGAPCTTQLVFEALKEIGVRLALDDFGTGYSSLGYLRDAPFDTIKIDQTFIRGVTEEGNNNVAIITAIVSLAQALGMETVAEGVEAQDELELVRVRGVSLTQGCIFSKAIPQAAILERIEQDTLEFSPSGPAKHRAHRFTVFRRIGVIHEDHRYDVVLRNISTSGALIEGMLDVPVGTDLVLDLGQGQLAIATVRRSAGAIQGVQFETALVSDGADGLCTRHRVNPYSLAAAGMPMLQAPQNGSPLSEKMEHVSPSPPKFKQVAPNS